ncbi:threonine synthase [Aestuariimicrobium soli]|uniref:threonine synthase n=1 Tax=Aestuariimicrobium soli TaxID=2035834 RepID=UPI003EB8BF0A
MLYLSTRDTDIRASFCDILLEGLAAGGGLYLPESYPTLTTDDLAALRALHQDEGYAAVGHRILSLFIDDIPSDDLRDICERAWNGEVFSDPAVVPVSRLDAVDERLWLAHLSEGPTAAFKDLAMQLLGQLFEYELARRGQTLTILGATSGDTGSAAEYAMRGRAGIETFMLTPAGRMTPFQQAQMFSLDDPGVHNLAVDGVFDDCQDLVKAVMADADFKREHSIGAVNSINWARLVAQVVYYVIAWLEVTDRDDQQVSFTVPTGNFGNVCAGHVARQLGLPIRRLVVATNENDVLDEFFRTGIYRPRGSDHTPATSSPSMDISKASNLERFIFDLVGRDAARLRELFAGDLPERGFFDLSDDLGRIGDQFGFSSGSSTHADRVATIRRVHAEAGVTIDPHTADGVKVALDQLDQLDQADQPDDEPMIVLETALPVKFADTIREALGHEPEFPTRFAGLLEAPRHVDDLPLDVEALKHYIARHRG